MRRMFVLLVCSFAGVALADHTEDDRKPIPLLPGLGKHHHPVSTKNREAQKFFDQGLTLLYGFNHDAAARSFARAAELDPELAMAHWGVALVRGSNYNLEADEKELKAAHEAVQKALKLLGKASEPERDYVQALAKRYSPNPKADKKELALNYKKAMGELARKYPDDLDAATLYAESAMNLNPWKLWSKDGKPAEGTEEIVAVLESVLRRNPDHPGANHYYIHAVEASPTPERALPSAQRLETLVPSAGHLVHMPAHIYMRVGDYEGAVRANAKAAAVDEAYIKAHRPGGVYPMMYYSHNLHFLAVAHAMQGRTADALQAAEKLAAHVKPHVEAMPMLEGFLPIPTLMLVRCGRWDDIVATPAPDAKLKYTKALWHYARALAFFAKGEPKAAGKERDEFLALKKTIPEDAKASDLNTAQHVLGIAQHVLDAKLALAEGDAKKAIERFRQAIEEEDALNYTEPADWLLPVRETLGAVLLASGDAAQAERVFRADLERNRRNPRSLFGLREALKAQKKDYAANLVDQEFRSAWKNAAGVELRLSDF